MRDALERAPLILEHRHYRGARAPTRLVFDDFDDLVQYLERHAYPGDAFWCWRYDAVCRDDNVLVTGKQPDADGTVPAHGPY